MAVELKNKVKASERNVVGKASINLSIGDMEYGILQSGGASINKGVVILINRMRELEAVGLLSLRGIFSVKEWKFLAVCVRTKSVSNDQYLAKEVFIKQILDNSRLDILTELYEVDKDKLITRLMLLSPLQMMSINCRIRDLWNKYSGGVEIPGATFDRWATL